MASNYSLVKSPQLSHNVRLLRKTAETMRYHNESYKQNLLRGWGVNVCTGPSGQTSLFGDASVGRQRFGMHLRRPTVGQKKKEQKEL